ncbi:MAG TPA: DUF2017 domain-containing protein [Mycobacteriales bacterium]|nr:DUF2017 domain-containing protein [Mycobacteriales bacterium]
MASVKRRGEKVVVRLDAAERSVLASLLGAVRALLADEDDASGETDPLAAFVGMSDGPVETPEDPILLRLLPDAYADAEQSAEFRRLTDSDLRARKTEAIDRVLDDVAGSERLDLDLDEGIGMWVQAINDVRLVLGTRLDVTEDWPETLDDLPPDDPRAALYDFYGWLSALQDRLVVAAMDD